MTRWNTKGWTKIGNVLGMSDKAIKLFARKHPGIPIVVDEEDPRKVRANDAELVAWFEARFRPIGGEKPATESDRAAE